MTRVALSETLLVLRPGLWTVNPLSTNNAPRGWRIRRDGLCRDVCDQSVVASEIASLGRLVHRPKPKSANRPEGFSLLEMMLVVTLILIVVSIATPSYKTCEVRTREAVLRDHLYTLRFLIDRFTLDNGRAPLRLKELVEKGYLGRLPTDPFTGSNETWQETKEDAPLSPSQIRQLTDWGLKTCTAARISFT
jgi:general secretion pathway protein G